MGKEEPVDRGRHHTGHAADLVFVGGTIATMDPSRPVAEGVAIRGSRIVAVGSSRDALAHADEDTEILDLTGLSLVPGLIDNHVHMTNAWQRAWVDTTYPRCQTIDDVVDAVAVAAADRPIGTWVIGRGFEPRRLAERRPPNRHDLDRLVPDHKVGLCNREGMGWTFNTAGLRSLGVEDTTPDPPGGPMERDAAGVPLGPMWDNARTVFIVPNLPRPGDDDLVDGDAWIERELLAFGVTTAHEAGYKEARHARAWTTLRQRQGPGMRVVLGPYPLAGSAWDEDGAPGCAVRAGLSSGFGDEWLSLGALQMGVDGGLIGATAALLEPYSDRTDGYAGSFRVDQSTLSAAVRRADEAGWSTGLICQGDAGIGRALAAIRQLGRPQRRHRLEHAYVWTPDLIDEMARLGVVWNTQPAMLPLTGPYLGGMFGDRSRWTFPFRSMVQAGVVVSGGSDWGVGPLNPFLGIDALVNHRSDVDPDAPPRVADERISLMQALQIYTLGGAMAGNQEHDRGSIEAGKLADLAVLGTDVTTVPDDEVGRIEVRQTYVGGTLRHSTGPLQAASGATRQEAVRDR
jgi:predicted amidohydrolase YtcJ